MSARLTALGAGILVAAATSALAQGYGDPAAGERLAAEDCAQCHGSLDAQDGAPAFVAIAAAPSTTAQSLTAFLQTPHGSMPDLILSAEDRANLVAYILSLRP